MNVAYLLKLYITLISSVRDLRESEPTEYCQRVFFCPVDYVGGWTVVIKEADPPMPLLYQLMGIAMLCYNIEKEIFAEERIN